MFTDYTEAASQLAAALSRYRGSRPIVFSVARGSFRIGQYVARSLEAEFDVALVSVFGAMYNVNYAVGAIDESGASYVPGAVFPPEAPNAYLERERASLLDHLHQRRSLYTPHRSRLNAAERIVIVVDDAILTGMTMIAALQGLRADTPDRLIGAVPVATRAGLEATRPYADELVCLSTPAGFRDVRQAYSTHPAISDAEILSNLASKP